MLFLTFCNCHFVHLNLVVNCSSSQVSMEILSSRMSNIQRKLNWLSPISQVIVYSKYLLYDTLVKSTLHFVVALDNKYIC
jgi:hypothetical protein